MNAQDAHATINIAKSSNTSANLRRDTFPFLSLPPEMRNEIYGWCLAMHDNEPLIMKDTVTLVPEKVISNTGLLQIRIYPTKGPCRLNRAEGRSRAVPLITSILRINKQIHAEAASLLYSRLLSLQSYKAMAIFLGELAHSIASSFGKFIFELLDMTST
ncbi:hypothetical protein BT63DRAFT_105255 [Microthyrium microscopicum]|uniref:Uncharacterized protein n=1 Tax=Microthyrium microscopicum TaxID=703497 RepID=A0A6A6TZI0_9PEZI|nr:hypothetical protein BT63DRAFT_105255 [Microthyrium microscopicum]